MRRGKEENGRGRERRDGKELEGERYCLAKNVGGDKWKSGCYPVCPIFLFSVSHKASHLLWCERALCETEDGNY